MHSLPRPPMVPTPTSVACHTNPTPHLHMGGTLTRLRSCNSPTGQNAQGYWAPYTGTTGTRLRRHGPTPHPTYTPTTYTDVHLPHAGSQNLELHRYRLHRPAPPTPPPAPCPSRPMARRTRRPPPHRPATHTKGHPTQHQQPRATPLAPPPACQPTPTSQDRHFCPPPTPTYDSAAARCSANNTYRGFQRFSSTYKNYHGSMVYARTWGTRIQNPGSLMAMVYESTSFSRTVQAGVAVHRGVWGHRAWCWQGLPCTSWGSSLLRKHSR